MACVERIKDTIALSGKIAQIEPVFWVDEE